VTGRCHEVLGLAQRHSGVLVGNQLVTVLVGWRGLHGGVLDVQWYLGRAVSGRVGRSVWWYRERGCVKNFDATVLTAMTSSDVKVINGELAACRCYLFRGLGEGGEAQHGTPATSSVSKTYMRNIS
jgi:hypothetical protein